MVDIQSPTAEIRRGKKKEETTDQKYNGLPYFLHRAAIMNHRISQPSTAGEFPTVIGNRGLSNVNIRQLFHGHLDARVTAAKTVSRRIRSSNTRLGLLHDATVATSTSVGVKSAAIQQWISEMKLDLAALVELWHGDATSPQLIACALLGYKYPVRRNGAAT